jgi:pheromone shutdown protein TraB
MPIGTPFFCCIAYRRRNRMGAKECAFGGHVIVVVATAHRPGLSGLLSRLSGLLSGIALNYRPKGGYQCIHIWVMCYVLWVMLCVMLVMLCVMRCVLYI